MTFSIVAWDHEPESSSWGVAVASKFLGVGAVVPFAQVDCGAIATQAVANLSYGPNGLDQLRSGMPAPEVIAALVDADPDREQRQVGVVDANGGAAAFTGKECFDWAGHEIGDGFACQGNILSGPEVVDAMARAFESSEGALPHRLLIALRAGDQAGGDRRGRQSAALLVVRRDGGYGGTSDIAADLRVDDHPDPVPELFRLRDLHELYFPQPEDLEFVPIDEELAGELRHMLVAAGHSLRVTGGFDSELRAALFAFMGRENLEERWTDNEAIETKVLDRLREIARSG